MERNEIVKKGKEEEEKIIKINLPFHETQEGGKLGTTWKKKAKKLEK